MGRNAVATKESVLAAIEQLRESGAEISVNAVREITGGANVRIKQLIEECGDAVNANQSRLSALSPSLYALGTQLFEQAVLRILSELDGEAARRIKHIEDDAAEAVRLARKAEIASYESADRVEERLKTITAECENLKHAAASAEGRAAQQATEIERLHAALSAAQNDRQVAAEEAAQLRGLIGEYREQVLAAKQAESRAATEAAECKGRLLAREEQSVRVGTDK